MTPQTPNNLATSSNGKTVGLVLGSGAARGWAHVGVLEGLEEIGVKPDIIAGCSVGALVGAAYLIDALEPFAAWARELQPLSALSAFSLDLNRGGLINPAPAFEAFREYDRMIEDLPVKFGAVAADLGTGEEVWITEGSIIDAARASSAIPVAMHSVRRGDRWMIDGAVANPAPVTLARHLGADVVIAVNLNAAPKVLDRFNPPPPSPPALRDETTTPAPTGLSGAIDTLIFDTRKKVQNQINRYAALIKAEPHLFETAFAAADIFQMHLARARADADPADIMLTPDMSTALPTSFDQADEFIAEGKRVLLEQRAAIEAAVR